MFGNLTDKFNNAFRKLSGQAQITESNVREAMDEVREALLEADVHYEVVQAFTKKVQEKALGEDVLKQVKPGQQMIKIINDELVELMGPVDTHLMEVKPGPTIVMMAGLQGSGKTTTCGKLAALLKKRGKKVMLCAADLQRPAAVQQLATLADQVEREIEGAGEVLIHAELDKVAEYGKAVGVAVKVCQNALRAAKDANVDFLILDTAGRLHINDDLMGELRAVNNSLNPHQIYLVIDAMTGQDAVNSAKAFNEQLELDGIVLTKFDSDTRGGAALSVKYITGAPIKFMGTGEKLDALEEFHPDRIAGRILGMGDVVSLVEKAQEQVSEEEAQALQDKMAAGKLTMDDFLKQLKTLRRMGSMKSLLGMLPGIGQQLQGLDLDDKQIDSTEAMILSMTKEERHDADIINNPRRRRIAAGSGHKAEAVGQLCKGFGMMSKMGMAMSDMSSLGRIRSMAGMNQQQLAAMSSGKGALRPQKKEPARARFKDRKKKRR